MPGAKISLLLVLETRNEAVFNINVVKSFIGAEYQPRTAHDGESDGAASKITHGHGRGNLKMFDTSITCFFFCKKAGQIKADCRKCKKWKSENGGENNGTNMVEQDSAGKEVYCFSSAHRAAEFSIRLRLARFAVTEICSSNWTKIIWRRSQWQTVINLIEAIKCPTQKVIILIF